MADVHIESEKETDSGWQFTIRIAPGAGNSAGESLTLTLSWADYDHWSSGTEPPSDVARHVIEFVLASRSTDALPPRFDAATVRRWLPHIDDVLSRRR